MSEVIKDRRKQDRRIQDYDHGWVDDPKDNGIYSMKIYSLNNGDTWYRDNRRIYQEDARRECDRSSL